MAESARERAVLALVAAAKTVVADVWRETDIERETPPGGMIQIAEAEYEPEPILSPLSYAHEMPAEVILTVEAIDEINRDAKLDALLRAFSAAVLADRTLAGAVEWAEIGPPAFVAFEGNAAGKAARIAVTLCFTSIGSPLS